MEFFQKQFEAKTQELRKEVEEKKLIEIAKKPVKTDNRVLSIIGNCHHYLLIAV